MSVQSFPILLTLKKCAVTSSNLKEKENLHDVTKHAEKDLQNFREALIFILRQNCFTVMGSISRIKFCHFAVLSKYFCCVFWPANGCFTNHMQVEIIFFHTNNKKEEKRSKNKEKHEKGVYQCFIWWIGDIYRQSSVKVGITRLQTIQKGIENRLYICDGISLEKCRESVSQIKGVNTILSMIWVK